MMLTSFGLVCRCCSSLLQLLLLLMLLLFCFISRHVIAAASVVVVVAVAVAKWGRVRVDFCTLHFKYEHTFLSVHKTSKTKRRGE